MTSHLSCLSLSSSALHPPHKGNAKTETERDCGCGCLTVCMSMCVSKCTSLKRVYVPVCVFENVCASLPLTFCCLGGQENLTRPSKIRLSQCNVQPDLAWTVFYFINSPPHSADKHTSEEADLEKEITSRLLK